MNTSGNSTKEEYAGLICKSKLLIYRSTIKAARNDEKSVQQPLAIIFFPSSCRIALQDAFT